MIVTSYIGSFRSVKMKFQDKPINEIRQILIWISVIPADNDTKWQTIGYRILSLNIFIILLSAAAASITFCYKFISLDLEASLYSMAQISAFGAMIYTIIATFFIRHHIEALFDSLHTIYETSKIKL